MLIRQTTSHLSGARRLARLLATAAPSSGPPWPRLKDRRRAAVGVQDSRLSPAAIAHDELPVAAAADVLRQVLTDARSHSSGRPSPSVAVLAEQLAECTGVILPFELAYESTPACGRRVDMTAAPAGIGILAAIGCRGKLATSLTFSVGLNGDAERSALVAFNGFQRDDTGHAILDGEDSDSSAAVISPGQSSRPITSVLSALLPSPLVLLASSTSSSTHPVRTLPVSPYPAPVGTHVRYPIWVSPTVDDAGDWRWVDGRVVGYRDYAGNTAQTGTYDTLAHMLLDPPPPASVITAGAPLIDVSSGAVVGVLTARKVSPTAVVAPGTEVGWAVPAERLFEGFQLPGMAGKR